MSANRLVDMETGKKIGSPYILLGDSEGVEIFISKTTFRKKALDKLINYNTARNWSKNLGIKVYRVYLKYKKSRKTGDSQLMGYLTSKKLRESFNNSYVLFNGSVPLSLYKEAS